MPLTVDDMYAFGEQSLYLIKVRDLQLFPIHLFSEYCQMIIGCYTSLYYSILKISNIFLYAALRHNSDGSDY